jgi:hypothetical protein
MSPPRMTVGSPWQEGLLGIVKWVFSLAKGLLVAVIGADRRYNQAAKEFIRVVCCRTRKKGVAPLLPELGCLAIYIGYVSRVSICLC